MTWGAALREQARADLERLVTAGIRAAEPVLEAGRWLPPMPLFVTFAGELRALKLDQSALSDRRPASLVSAAIYLLAQHAPEARAVALVTGSRLAAERRDAIEVWAEHRDGAALTVLRPGPGRGSRPTSAYRGSRLVWATER